MSCEATFDWCMNELWGPILEAGRNVYDISMECHGDGVDCYWEEKCVYLEPGEHPLMPSSAIIALLNSDYIRKLIKTDAQPARFATSSDAVMKDFFAAGEMLISSAPWIAGLLERGVRVLLYAGSYDMACSWLTTDRASLAIEWTGQEVFSEAPMREWEVDGQKAGKVRSSGLLSFASIYGAGHMVGSTEAGIFPAYTDMDSQAPHDKPRESLEMINRWLAEEPL
jgi:carboxypeptidase C (cathepsin A)